MLRRTPCVGICSTTYGDLVCRGCKRFAHEIVQWNGFDQPQRQAVWERLLDLRAGAVGALLAVDDHPRLLEAAERLGLPGAASLAPENLLYELLQRLPWREQDWTLEQLGARTVAADAAGLVPEELLAAIDREFYRRSLAQYERNYRIPAQ